MIEAGRRFPQDFLWGSATSSYQIEGAVGGRPRRGIWDRFCATPGAIKDGSNGDVACDHYHRYPEDIALMRRAQSQRLPLLDRLAARAPGRARRGQPGRLDFYDRLVDALLPPASSPSRRCTTGTSAGSGRRRWLARASNRRGLRGLRRDRRRRLGDRVSDWMTLNEPFVSANHGYLTGEHTPDAVRSPTAWRPVTTCSSATVWRWNGYAPLRRRQGRHRLELHPGHADRQLACGPRSPADWSTSSTTTGTSTPSAGSGTRNTRSIALHGHRTKCATATWP